jgi:hypothetical protein
MPATESEGLSQGFVVQALLPVPAFAGRKNFAPAGVPVPHSLRFS